MASDEIKKKWGTIFMGNREASVQQLQAMQEPLHREKRQKNQAEEYMERVRARAADRAREILGAAYAERQKVLEEARADAMRYRKEAEIDCGRLKTESENAHREALAELEKARKERQDAESLRLAARDEGYQEGLQQSATELNEFRADLGQSLGSLLRAIERERHQILDSWRADIVELVQCASQAGSGFVLQKEHKTVLKNLVFQALEQLENRSIVHLRVHPADEDAINGIFKAAKDRFPELKQWVISGDEAIEQGGLVAESGTGSIDLRRENFRELVDGVLAHLGLPEGAIEENADRVIRELVEKEVANIAGLTPEMDKPEMNSNESGEVQEEITSPESVATMDSDIIIAPDDGRQESAQESISEETVESMQTEEPDIKIDANEPVADDRCHPDLLATENPTLEDLEAELFPIEEVETQKEQDIPAVSHENKDTGKPADPLSEGGFI